MDLRVSEINKIVTPEIQKTEKAGLSDDFQFALKRLGKEGLSERLNNLIGDITTAGKKLADHMDIKDMKNYRSLVGDFIQEVVTNSHQFERENFLDRRGRHRVYGIVKVINQDLDDLAQELLKKEKDHLKILDKTDEIRGLLLDIMI